MFAGGKHGSGTAAVTTAVLEAQNLRRAYFFIYNKTTDAAEIIWLTFGSAGAAGEGIPVPKGCWYELNETNMTTAQINIISSSGSPAYSYHLGDRI